MSINKSYTFSNNTVADPAEVNQNFDDSIAAIRAAHHQDADGTPIEPDDIAAGWGLVPQFGIMMFHGLISAIPAEYFFCNGANGTPDLRNKFVLCAGQDSGGTYDVGDTGGEAAHVLTTEEMPAHAHSTDADKWYGTRWASYWQSSGPGTDVQIGFSDATVSSAGGGSAHNNMPPFKALVFIMKS